MNLGGIVLVVLTIILAAVFAVGIYALLAGDRARDRIHPVSPGVPEEHVPGEELPPREDAWKPAVWYSEAEGTLFPNQPSPSFRISADSSLQRAITRRELEDLAVDSPTEPQPALPSRASAPADQTPQSIPDEVEALSEMPTVMMKIAPAKDNLPPTVKMRAVRRSRFTPPLPEAETHSNGSTPTMGDIPTEIVEMEPISYPLPAATPAYEPIPDEVELEGSADTVVLEPVDDEDAETYETYAMQAPAGEPEPLPTAAAGADPGWTWTPELAPERPVEEPKATWGEDQLAEVELEPVDLPVAEPSQDQSATGLPIETEEQRYDRILLEAYSQAIHLRFDEELDAIEVGFTNCPVMESSDVPWIFQAIGGKIQELLASDVWRPHGLLLDVAGLQVAPEAEAAWEMVLDGFVTQLCPEVAPRIALAIQYDSSAQHDSGDEEETTPELQRASSVTGQPRPLVVARSYEAALLLLQLMRREF